MGPFVRADPTFVGKNPCDLAPSHPAHDKAWKTLGKPTKKNREYGVYV